MPRACAVIFGLELLVGSVIAQPAPRPTRSPVLNDTATNVIPDQYIVVFKPGTSREVVQGAQKEVRRLGGTIGFMYTAALNGFSATLPPAALERLRAIREVDYVEADRMGRLSTTQLNPPIGLDRTDQRLLPLNTSYSYSETGAGVHVYVIDSGIQIKHTDFGGRAFGAFTAFTNIESTEDCANHGTHVAGIIGGTTYGIAKEASLYSVCVCNCGGKCPESGIIAAVDWVTKNAIHPAVANMSLEVYATPTDTALATAVNSSIASGITYIVAAGNDNFDACKVSPAKVPKAITVGSIDSTSDTRDPDTNFGACIDLFAPGVNIVSAIASALKGSAALSGTSMAAPHVAGVAALYLQNHQAATAEKVWDAIHNANDVSSTAGWAGIIEGGPGSPNELLHWGPFSDGFNDGDPHLTTVDGVHYDFQGAGEFVALRDGHGLEIQTRQTPVATTFDPGPNPYTGLATCVSINTAVAVRVSGHRVTYQPNAGDALDPSALQLRVDGVVTSLDAQGLTLGAGARVIKSPAGAGLEIDFADDTIMIVTPGWWDSQKKWYLTVSLFHTRAREGIMGAVAPGSWLPALPDGTSLGPMPTDLHQRSVDLNRTFADAWRVTDQTSLFDYAPGMSSATFTLRDWPQESPPCVVPGNEPAKPLDAAVAREVCRDITGKNRNADCVFDVTVTGERGFARTYFLGQQIDLGSTRTTVSDNKNPTRLGEPVIFTATVTRNKTAARGESPSVPTGSVQFIVDGIKAGQPIKLDSKGHAARRASNLDAVKHRAAAIYVPDPGSMFLPSTSLDEFHTVAR